MVRTALFFLLSLLAVGCNEIQQAVKEAKNEIPPPPKDNYIILLDLSDRILANDQQQVSKDLTVIRNLYGLFKSNLNKKDPSHLYYGLNDKLKILIAPQKTTPGKLYEQAGLLRVDLSSELPEKKSKVIQEADKTFNTILPDVYRQALVSKHTSGYTGADIWKYFNEDLSDDLDKDAQNTLFILTDGYMDFERTEDRPTLNKRYSSCAQIINQLKNYSDWSSRFEKEDYGLMPVSKKFSKLKVVLLQIDPNLEWPGEYPLLTKIWSKWFKEMNVDTFSYIKNDNIGEVRESMEKFMQVRVTGKIEPAMWTAIELPDSSSASVKTAALLARQKNLQGGSPTAEVFKKKDKSEGSDFTNTNDKIAARPLTLPDTRQAAKRTIKQKEQVTFGPAY